MTIRKKAAHRCPSPSGQKTVSFIPLMREGDLRTVPQHLRDLERVVGDHTRLRIQTRNALHTERSVKKLHIKSIQAESYLAHAQAAVAAALCEETSHAAWIVRVTVDAWKYGEAPPEEIEPLYVTAQLPAVKAVRVR